MKHILRVGLGTNPAQEASLRRLQESFSDACNALAPIVQQTRCWNRVALHHMAYKSMREKFPDLGSQMVCNAIYSVSRAARRIYQGSASPFNINRHPGQPLPLMRFLPQAPVYFDRHTLSLKNGQVSLYTQEGRMRFTIGLSEADQGRFHTEKLREIALTSQDKRYHLNFVLTPKASGDNDQPAEPEDGNLPEYLLVFDGAQTVPHIPAQGAPTQPMQT